MPPSAPPDVDADAAPAAPPSEPPAPPTSAVDDDAEIFRFIPAPVIYEINLHDITAVEWQLIRAATGYPSDIVIGRLQALDLECIAAVVWIIRMRAGETDLEYLTVASTLTLRALDQAAQAAAARSAR